MMAIKIIAMTTTPAAPALATTGMRGKSEDGSVDDGEGGGVVGGAGAVVWGTAGERERENTTSLKLVNSKHLVTYIFSVVLN